MKNQYPILKTITIGGMTKAAYLQAFKKHDIQCSDYALSMIDRIEFQKEKEDIAIARMTVTDFDIGAYPTTDQIYACLKKKGLELLPAEAALAIRLAYREQPKHEWLRVGMKQIADSDGSPNVFLVGRNSDGLWLNDYWARPTSTWLPEDEFLFRLPQVVSSNSLTLSSDLKTRE